MAVPACRNRYLGAVWRAQNRKRAGRICRLIGARNRSAHLPYLGDLRLRGLRQRPQGIAIFGRRGKADLQIIAPAEKIFQRAIGR